MIPKIIHYCWFGKGEMPPIMHKCIKSWKKRCPDWEIICWDEESFDVDSTVWTKQAYEAKKFAFVADYVRIKAIAEYGGVYLDADQELIKTLDYFLQHKAFLGFLDKSLISAGVMGAEPGHPIIKQMLHYYDNRSFYTPEGGFDTRPNTDWMTDILLEKGLKLDDSFQELENIVIYPRTYFCPTSCISPENAKSRNTVSIHHWAMTWRSEKAKKDFARVKRHQTWWYRTWEKARVLPMRIVRRIFGDDTVEKMRKKIKK